MRFLIDNCLAEAVANELVAAGHEAEHVRPLGFSRASDDEVMLLAIDRSAIVVSADTDFGTLLSESGATGPSIVLFRLRERRRAPELVALLLDNLDAVADDLEAGAVVAIEDQRIRVRRLPILDRSDSG
jgi:predicted nuclease of predicted toxin-antitoxin system